MPRQTFNKSQLEKAVKSAKKYLETDLEEFYCTFIDRNPAIQQMTDQQIEDLASHAKEVFQVHSDAIFYRLKSFKKEKKMDQITENRINSVAEWKVLFDRINADNEKSGDGSVVAYSDTEYYADQIQNIIEMEGNDITWQECAEIASALNNF